MQLNKTILIVFMLSILFITNVWAQIDSVWTRFYGGEDIESCQAIHATADGGYVLGGYRTAVDTPFLGDFYILRIDANGDTLWTHSYGAEGLDRIETILQTADGGYAMSGYSYSFGGQGSFWLLRLNANGDSLWSRSYGGSLHEVCYDMLELQDGSLLLAGYSITFGPGNADFWLLKVSSAGDSLWSRAYGGEMEDKCYDIAPTSDGGFVLAGSTESFGSLSEVLLIKTNADGDSLWSRLYGGESLDWCNSVEPTPDGGYLLAGRTMSFGSFHDFIAVKTDSLGNEEWHEQYDGGNVEVQSSLLDLDDGTYIIGGYTSNGGDNGQDFYAVQIDLTGNELWSHNFGTAGTDDLFALAPSARFGFVAVGETQNESGIADIMIAKYEPPNAPPGDFMRLSPFDCTLISENVVALSWSTAFDPDRDDIQYLYEVYTPTLVMPMPVSGATADTSVAITIPAPPDTTPSGVYDFYWTIRATDGLDTVSALNGEGVFFYQYAAPNLPPDPFMRLQPLDCSLITENEVTLVWSAATDSNGDAVQYFYEVGTTTFMTPEPASGATSDTFAVITIPAPPDTTPSGFYDYYWNVFATDGMDTTYALNGQGVFFFEYNAPNLPPGEFTRLIPADSSVDDFNGSCAWSASLDPDGDSITYLFHLDSNYPYFFSPTDSVVSDTTIHVEIEIPVSQLDELYWFNWTVHATDGVDTVEAANGAGVFGVDIILASNEQNSVVNEFGLSIYPNPFNPSTTIQYTLDQTGPVSIAVMDVLGRQVAELVNETMNPGRYALHWTAQGSNGAMLPSGSYWVHLNTPGRQAIHRILLIR